MKSFKDVDNLLVREGDVVKVLRGSFEGKVGSVCEVTDGWVYVELEDGPVIRVKPKHLKLFARKN